MNHRALTGKHWRLQIGAVTARLLDAENLYPTGENRFPALGEIWLDNGGNIKTDPSSARPGHDYLILRKRTEQEVYLEARLQKLCETLRRILDVPDTVVFDD